MQYANKAKRSGKDFIGGCPLCHEGKSWGKKWRAKYFPQDNYYFCHNECGGMTPYQWIKAATGWDYKSILADVIGFSGAEFLEKVDDLQGGGMSCASTIPALPWDSVNITDSQQLEFYSDNSTICHARRYIESRRLVTAKHSPGNFFVSLTDPVHKDRLVIPYYNGDGSIVHYQSRALYDKDDRPKYLSKFDSIKTPFNSHNFDCSIPYYLVFEGAMDAMFVQNGTAVTGVHMSDDHRRLLAPFDLFMERIWVLDNQSLDDTARAKTIKLAEAGETVFVWPTQMRKFKDINELAVDKDLDEVPHALFKQFAKTGADLKFAV